MDKNRYPKIKDFNVYLVNQNLSDNIEISIYAPPDISRISSHAFNDCTNLRTVEIQNNSKLNTIEKFAFFNCAFKNITIPTDVTMIGCSAFNQCVNLEVVSFAQNSKLSLIEDCSFCKTSITSIKIPSKVTKIGDGCFYHCNNLKSVCFFENSELKEICRDAFFETAIESIEIPEKVTVIGERAFKKCKKLKTLKFSENSKLSRICEESFMNTLIESVFIPTEVSTIETMAFFDCPKLATVTFSEHSKLETLDDCSFSKCMFKSVIVPKSVSVASFVLFSIFKNFNVPEKLQSIGNYAFQECESLTKIEFKNKIDINTQAFYNCKKLREVSIYLDKLQNSVFYYCDKNLCVKLFTDKTILETADIGNLRGCFSYISYLIIPDTVQQINFPHSNQYQYHDNYLKGIEIPPSIQNLDFLCYFKSLTEITYDPYSSTINCDSKNNSNFYNIRHIIIKTNHKILDENLCKNIINISVSKITISSEIKSIKKDAFAGLYSLNEVVIPPKVKLIETGAFPADKSHLNTITIDPYRTTIQPYAFPKISGYYFTINIQNEKIDRNIMQNLLYISDYLTISGNVKIVEPQTFASSSLRSIAFNSKITHIGDYAFTECTSLTNAIFPKSLLHVGKYAFRGCSQLTFISCPNRPSQSYYGYTNYSLLPYAQFIGEYAFDGCTGLQKILINKNAKVEENGKGNYIYQRIDIKDLHMDEEKVKIKAEEEEEEREELFSELYGCE